MPYISIIKDGIHTVHKNWQLVIIQFLSLSLSFMSFFIIVGIPIAIAFIIFGLDLTEILKLKDVFSALKDSAGLLQKYFAMAVVILISLLLYLAFIVVLWTFTFSGIIGVITDTILDEKYRFTMKNFITEGKRYFFPVLFFSAIIGAIFIVLAFILGILGGIASSIIELAKTQEVTFALFLGVFFSLVLVSSGVFLILITLSITVYGVASLSFFSAKPFDALRRTLSYLYKTPSAIVFYGIIMLGYLLAGFLVILIGSPLTFIPIVGPILSAPYQLMTYIVQGYIGLITVTSTFHFFHKTACAAPKDDQAMSEFDCTLV